MKLFALVAILISTTTFAEEIPPLHHFSGYIPGTGQLELTTLNDGRIQVVFDKNTCQTTPGGRPTTCTEAPAYLWRVRPQPLPGSEFQLTFNLRLYVRYTHDGPKFDVGIAVFEDREYGTTITGWRWISLKEPWELP